MALSSTRCTTRRITRSRSCLAPTYASRPHASRARRPAAFKEADSFKDWRTKKMIDMTHTYFHDVWSKGDTQQCYEILADDFVHKENIWHPDRLIAGPHAFSQFVKEIKTEYPDLTIEVQQVAVSDAHHVFVLWQGSGTNLAPVPGHARPSYHESHMAGVDIFTFNNDRSRIVEVSVFRKPLHEEREELLQQQQEDQLEIHLKRLHFEGGEQH